MNRQRILQTACLVAATLLMATCTQDGPADAGDTTLPEGRYPMTFATAVEGLTVTRANTAGDGTADGVWRTTDEIAVQVESNVKQYTPTTGGASTTLQAASGVEPFYWQTSNEKKTVSAWYCGTGYNATLPTTWTWEVKPDQSTNDGYQQSDFLYAPATDITFANRENASLTFYHQLSKVTVHVIRGEQTPANITDIAAVTVGNGDFKRNGKFNSSEISGDNPYGTWTDADTPVKGTITAKKAPEAATLTDKTVLATFHALVIPQMVAGGQQLFALTAAGYGSPFIHKAKEGETTWDLGKEYTYEITINGTTLSVTSVSETIGWGQDGATGAGSVTLPVIYDLSTAGEIIINDDRKYIITGEGSNAVTISGGSPNVTLQDVTIRDNVIKITGGTPTLVIKGNVTLTKGEIQMQGKSTHIVIEGDGRDGKLTATGIGSINQTCGNITIKGITAQINKREEMGGGIGGVQYGNCGNIKIENATINIANSHGAAAIGCGAPPAPPESGVTKCGDIEIIKSDITAYAGNYSALSPAAIGCCGSFSENSKGSCGNITITLKAGQTKEDFLSELKVFHPAFDKVGLGGWDQNTLRGKVGVITWKDANGQVLETVAARDVN